MMIIVLFINKLGAVLEMWLLILLFKFDARKIRRMLTEKLNM